MIHFYQTYILYTLAVWSLLQLANSTSPFLYVHLKPLIVAEWPIKLSTLPNSVTESSLNLNSIKLPLSVPTAIKSSLLLNLTAWTGYLTSKVVTTFLVSILVILIVLSLLPVTKYLELDDIWPVVIALVWIYSLNNNVNLLSNKAKVLSLETVKSNPSFEKQISFTVDLWWLKVWSIFQVLCYQIITLYPKLK